MSWWWTVQRGSGESRLCHEPLSLAHRGRWSLPAVLSEQHAANYSLGWANGNIPLRAPVSLVRQGAAPCVVDLCKLRNLAIDRNGSAFECCSHVRGHQPRDVTARKPAEPSHKSKGGSAPLSNRGNSAGGGSGRPKQVDLAERANPFPSRAAHSSA